MDERNTNPDSEDIDRSNDEDLIGSSQEDDDFEDVDEMDDDEDEDAEDIEA